MKKNKGYAFVELLITISVMIVIVQFLFQFLISTQKYVNDDIKKENIMIDQDMIATAIQFQFSNSISIDEVLTMDGKLIEDIPNEEISIKAIKLTQLDSTSQIEFGRSDEFYESNQFIFFRDDIASKPLCIHKMKSNQSVHCSDIIGSFHYQIGNGIEGLTIKKVSENCFEIGVILEESKIYHFFALLLE